MEEDLVIHFGGSSMQSMTFQKKEKEMMPLKMVLFSSKKLPVIDSDAEDWTSISIFNHH